MVLNLQYNLICTHISGSIAIGPIYNGYSLPLHIIDLNCTGTEGNIWNCPNNALLSQYSCSSSYTAAIACHGMHYSNLL